MGAGSSEGGLSASNVLKPPLARGKLQCIGATTLDEYRQHIEKDPAFARRFQVGARKGAQVEGRMCGAAMCWAAMCGAAMCGAAMCGAAMCGAGCAGAAMCGAAMCGAGRVGQRCVGQRCVGAAVCGGGCVPRVGGAVQLKFLLPPCLRAQGLGFLGLISHTDPGPGDAVWTVIPSAPTHPPAHAPMTHAAGARA
eukprot:360766-Chlamydomonas_euryale.AAC.5